MLYGLDSGKVMMIMTARSEDLSKAVIDRLGRGCTILDGKGGFTGRGQPVVVCAVRKSQYFELKRIVREIDDSAFMLALDAGEIIGEGFKDIVKSTQIT